jgi:hypothetical protein
MIEKHLQRQAGFYQVGQITECALADDGAFGIDHPAFAERHGDGWLAGEDRVLPFEAVRLEGIVLAE